MLGKHVFFEYRICSNPFSSTYILQIYEKRNLGNHSFYDSEFTVNTNTVFLYNSSVQI